MPAISLNEQQLKEVEQFAGLFYSVQDIAIIIEVDEGDLRHLFRDKKSKFFKRYMKAFLTAESEIRSSEIALAKRGSTPAQESVRKYTVDARITNQ